MAYGKRSIYRKSTAGSYRRSRFGTRSITKAPYRKKTRSYVKRPRFAAVGYVRDQEKKYYDKTARITTTWAAKEVLSHVVGGAGVVFGVKHTAGLLWYDTMTNLIGGVPGGSSAYQRIGNKINVKYLQVGMTLQAARSAMPMGGEQENNETAGLEGEVDEYMKTNFRIVLVKDLQANNNSNNISWDQVFGNSAGGDDNVAMASNDMLEISNMGRFIIVKDMRITLDAKEPLRSVNFIQRGIGEVRYSTNSGTSLTNVGYHLLVGQDTIGTAVSATRVKPSPVLANTRLCFTE